MSKELRCGECPANLFEPTGVDGLGRPYGFCRGKIAEGVKREASMCSDSKAAEEIARTKRSESK